MAYIRGLKVSANIWHQFTDSYLEYELFTGCAVESEIQINKQFDAKSHLKYQELRLQNLYLLILV